MLRATNVRVLVATEPADMRYSFDGLCGLVRHRLSEDPKTGTLFVFFNKRRDQVKVLYHDVGGFSLWSKRLHCGRFQSVGRSSDVALPVELPELYRMLEGVREEMVGVHAKSAEIPLACSAHLS